MNIFIICPVRNVSDEVRRKIEVHVEVLERQGHCVHYPPRDTEQNDSTGMGVCRANLMPLHRSVQVHVWWDPAMSEGSIFDLGALFMSSLIIGPKKKVVLINRDQVLPTVGKSFTNVILELARE